MVIATVLGWDAAASIDRLRDSRLRLRLRPDAAVALAFRRRTQTRIEPVGCLARTGERSVLASGGVRGDPLSRPPGPGPAPGARKLTGDRRCPRRRAISPGREQRSRRRGGSERALARSRVRRENATRSASGSARFIRRTHSHLTLVCARVRVVGSSPVGLRVRRTWRFAERENRPPPSQGGGRFASGG